MVFNKRRNKIIKCIRSIHNDIEYRPNTNMTFSVKVRVEDIRDTDIKVIQYIARQEGYLLTRNMKHVNGYMLSFQKVV